MKPRTYTSEGIILSRKNYQEADRIIIIFSKKFGKLSLIAKGIRKIKSRKRGHVEVFSAVRFSAVKGGTMDIVTEVETINDFPDIRKNLNKITLAYYFCEVIAKISREDEGSEFVYEILLKHLNKLNDSGNHKILRLEFLEKLLIEMGYWPDDKKLEDADVVLDEVLERKLFSIRVGKKVLQ